jgi:hypothetical protein
MEDKENKLKIAKEKLVEKGCEIIDDVAYVVQDACKKVFDVVVDQTKEITSDLFERYKSKAKENLRKKGCDDAKKESDISRDDG